MTASYTQSSNNIYSINKNSDIAKLKEFFNKN